jgi:hypothetical protein
MSSKRHALLETVAQTTPDRPPMEPASGVRRMT